MRIGEFEDAVGKQVAARREALTGDLARMGAKLAEPGHGAVSPAASVPDSVVLSAEARTAHLPRDLAGLPLPPFPSPLQLIAALKEFEAATTPQARADLAAHLSQLVVRLSRSVPLGAAVPPGENASAARLVRLLLGSPGAEEAHALLRQLLAGAGLASSASPATLPTTTYERAAVAILTAIMQHREGAGFVPAEPRLPQTFPAALLGLFAPPPAPRRRRQDPRHATIPDHEIDEEAAPSRGRADEG